MNKWQNSHLSHNLPRYYWAAKTIIVWRKCLLLWQCCQSHPFFKGLKRCNNKLMMLDINLFIRMGIILHSLMSIKPIRRMETMLIGATETSSIIEVSNRLIASRSNWDINSLNYPSKSLKWTHQIPFIIITLRKHWSQECSCKLLICKRMELIWL